MLYIQKGLEGTPEVLLDPNSWSSDSTVRLTAFAPSKDAKYAVYGVSKSGSDWQEFKVIELATKKTLSDNVEWVKVSGASWHGNGFFYSRYPAPEKGKEKASVNENHQVFFHRVGTPQSADELVYQDAANPQRFHFLDTTEDERFAILSVSDRGKGKDGNSIFVRDLTKGGGFVPVIPTIGDETFNVIDNVGDALLIETNFKAPNGRVILVNPAQPAEANWKTILPERPEPLQTATTAGGKLFTTYLKDVTTRAYVNSLEGKLEHEVSLPGLGIAGGFGGERDTPFVFYTFNSLNVPPTIYRYDIATKASAVFRQPKVPGYDPARARDEAGLLQEQGRHAGADVPRLSQGSEARWQQPDAALRLRRVQHRAVADLQLDSAGAARTGVRLRLSEHARRRRVRRVLAQGGDEAEEAERLRRLHRRGGMAHRQQVHVSIAARHPGRVERRAARRGGHEPAPRAVPRRHPAGRRHGHAAVRQVHDRLELDRRLRLERRLR